MKTILIISILAFIAVAQSEIVLPQKVSESAADCYQDKCLPKANKFTEEQKTIANKFLACYEKNKKSSVGDDEIDEDALNTCRKDVNDDTVNDWINCQEDCSAFLMKSLIMIIGLLYIFLY